MSSENPLAPLDIFRGYDEEAYNLLLPSKAYQESIMPLYESAVAVVEINTDPDAGEIYKIGSEWKPTGQKRKDDPSKDELVKVEYFGLAKPALERFIDATGIQIHPTLSEFEIDEPRRVRFKAVGGMRAPDGTLRTVTKRKEIDLDKIERKLQKKYADKAEFLQWRYDPKQRKRVQRNLSDEEKVSYIESEVDREVTQISENMHELAETKAFNRVVRALLAIRSKYTLAELEKPFVVPKTVFRPDMKDPQTKRLLLERGLDASSGLYPQGLDPRLEIGAVVEIPTADVEDDEPEIPEAPAPAPPPPAEAPPEDPRRAKRIAELEALEAAALKARFKLLIEKYKYPTQGPEADPAGVGRTWIQDGRHADAVYDLELWVALQMVEAEGGINDAA